MSILFLLGLEVHKRDVSEWSPPPVSTYESSILRTFVAPSAYHTAELLERPLLRARYEHAFHATASSEI